MNPINLTPKPNDNGQFHWGGLLNPMSSVAKYQAPPTPPRYQIKSRGISLDDNDIQQLARVNFGEASNRMDPTEIRHITNTALNRARNYGLSVSDVLSAPKQYQAYGGKQYNLAQNPDSLDSLSKTKYDFIIKVLNDLKSGDFQDTTNGYESYYHDTKGNIHLNPNKWKPSRSLSSLQTN
jgi:hypothetical protein